MSVPPEMRARRAVDIRHILKGLEGVRVGASAIRDQGKYATQWVKESTDILGQEDLELIVQAGASAEKLITRITSMTRRLCSDLAELQLAAKPIAKHSRRTRTEEAARLRGEEPARSRGNRKVVQHKPKSPIPVHTCEATPCPICQEGYR